jgi:cytochrome c oxidase subunit 4
MTGVKLYVGIWLGLVLATVLEVATKSIVASLSVLALVIIAIASVKAIFIALYYQHLRYESWRLAVLPVSAVIGIILLALAAGFSMNMGG